MFDQKVLQYGYYIFLGTGDYHYPEKLNHQWFATWNLSDWEKFFVELIKLKTNTLMIYLVGHELPYKSSIFPYLVQEKHPNVQNEFLSKVLSLGKKYGLNFIAVLSTTGHAGKYSIRYPELGIKPSNKKIDLNSLLTAFPEHIRKTKNIAQEGNAQIGWGVLCHNQLEVQNFAKNLIRECLEIYPYFDGIAFHPPESIYCCVCESCCKLYQEKNNDNLLHASIEKGREFYLESYLDFQESNLTKIVHSL
ncbi:MAG: hypothetical protein ACK4PR_05210, partial [Gammaproteobacteria bacterium]